MRHGNALGADWQDTDRFERAPDARQLLPLPDGVACFAVVGTTMTVGGGSLAPIREALSRKVVGDGLVSLESALGQHEDPGRNLAFAEENLWVAQGMNHMQLLSRPEVSRQLVHWLREPGV
ncbi:hypothetical protein LP416_17455 [Polaromonas sp. P2-4]|nr:hypothetical protein LP416_17455 [Polaromonas sp. P2-4]